MNKVEPHANTATIILSKTKFNAGDRIDGVVSINLIKPTTLKEISITLNGTEFISNMLSKDPETGFTNIFHTSPIKQPFSNKQISSSVVEVPFSFLIDQKLPSSFVVSGFWKAWEGTLKAHIQYEIRAEIKNSGEKIVSALPIEIHQLKPNAPITKPYIYRESETIKLCCCFKKGSIRTMIALKEGYFYEPGQVVDFEYDIDASSSSCEISMVEIVLSQQFGKSNFQKFCVCDGDKMMSLQIQDPESLLLLNKGERILSGKHSFTIPQNAPNSSNGNDYTQMKYGVTIVCKIKDKCTAPVEVMADFYVEKN